MSKFNILDRNLQVLGRHFLEASAGTGKTFAIEHFVTRLLIETEPSFSLEEILIVTFTKAATRELKSRVRQNLLRTQHMLKTQNVSIDYLKAICERGENAIYCAIKKIESALIQFETAPIFTLHGFCYRSLKENAMDANTSLNFSDPDKNAHLYLLNKLTKEYLINNLKFPKYSPYQIEILLRKYHNDYRKLRSVLISKVLSGKQLSSFRSFKENHERFLYFLNAFQPVILKHWIEDVEKLIPHYKKMTDERMSAQIHILGQLLETKTCTLLEFEKLLKEDLFLERMHSQNLKVKAKLPLRHSLYYPDLCEQVRTTLLPLLKETKDPLKIQFLIANDLINAFIPEIEKKEYFLPDMLLSKVEQALSTSSFVDNMQKKYRAVIIDEFQDTDPTQWSIVEKLFLNSAEVLCLVGDPKQSIYGFRNADIYTYLKAAAQLGENAKKHLDTNFRSTPSLVKALNTFFSKPVNGWMSLPALDRTLHVPMVHSTGNQEEENPTSLTFFIVEDKIGRYTSFPTTHMQEQKIFPFISSKILKIHREDKVPLHEFAILVKDRFEAKKIMNHLKLWGIPSHFKRGSLLTDSIAYAALKEIFEATLSPKDTSKLKSALGSILIGWDESALKKTMQDPELLFAKLQIQKLHRCLFHAGFACFFQTFLETCFSSDGACILETILKMQPLSFYMDLRKFAEILIEEEIHKGKSPNQLFSFLVQMEEEAQEDENRFRIPPQEELLSVVIMTTHSSKGLEFNTVFALGIGSRQRSSEEIYIKDKLVLFDPADASALSAVEEQDAEKMRQLYVAMTRAKERLFVPVVIDSDNKPLDYGTASAVELFLSKCLPTLSLSQVIGFLEEMKTILSYEVLTEIQSVNPVSFLPPTLENTQCESFSYPKQEAVLYSFSSLQKMMKNLEGVSLIDKEIPQNMTPHALPIGSATGQILHAIFEEIFKNNWHHPLDPMQIKTEIDRQIKTTQLEKFSPSLLPWIIDILTLELPFSFKLCDIPASQFFQEMEFHFPFSKGIMKGFCDLVFLFEGKYYLLDWKSNYLGPTDQDYTKENIEIAMQEHGYFLQASIYMEALKRYVKLFDNRCFESLFGGAIYFFVRGRAPYFFYPKTLMLDDALGNLAYS